MRELSKVSRTMADARRFTLRPAGEPVRQTILYVSPTQRMAMTRRAVMGDPSHVRFIGIGGALMGSQFEEIIIDGDWEEHWQTTILRQVATDWLETIRCRLSPDGRMRHLT